MAQKHRLSRRSASELLRESLNADPGFLHFVAFVKVGEDDGVVLVASNKDAEKWKALPVEFIDSLYADEDSPDLSQPRLARIALRPPTTREGAAYAVAASLIHKNIYEANANGPLSPNSSLAGLFSPAAATLSGLLPTDAANMTAASLVAPQVVTCPPGKQLQWDAGTGRYICV